MSDEMRLIDANALIARAHEDMFAYEAYNFEEYVSDAPTVDAKPVVYGRWEDVKETSLYVPDMKYTVTHTAETCSACKVRIGFIGSKPYLYDNICPNCGADMRDWNG